MGELQRRIGERAQAQADLPAVLDVVDQYGSARFNEGSAVTVDNAHMASVYASTGVELRARIAALVHWQPATPEDTPGALVPGEADEPPVIHLIAESAQARAGQPDALVLRLPEVPEGTVALVDRLGSRWVPAARREHWKVDDGNGIAETLHYLMWKYGPLTVEIAPPPEPVDQADTVYADGSHTYWSTHCRHDRHKACKASCKTCTAPCICPCHGEPR